MVFISITQQSGRKIDKSKYDNINTYENRSDVPDSDKVKDRLFYITSERTYYCWDTFTRTFEVAFDSSIDIKGLSDEMLMLKGKQILMDSAVNGNTSNAERELYDAVLVGNNEPNREPSRSFDNDLYR